MTIEKFAFCASRDVRRKVLTKYPFFKYVLSTMGVSKESISKFLIGNRFHVKLRILSLYSNRFCLNKVWEWFYLNKDWGCVILREIDFLLKICWSLPCLHPSWKVHTWIEICASLNHRKKTKADCSRLIPRKHTETLVLISFHRYYEWWAPDFGRWLSVWSRGQHNEQTCLKDRVLILFWTPLKWPAIVDAPS